MVKPKTKRSETLGFQKDFISVKAENEWLILLQRYSDDVGVAFSTVPVWLTLFSMQQHLLFGLSLSTDGLPVRERERKSFSLALTTLKRRSI